MACRSPHHCHFSSHLIERTHRLNAKTSMITSSLFLHAESAPLPGVAHPSPNQIYKNPRLEIRERELPPLGDFSVRVEMHYVGICGTDLHLVKTKPGTGYIECSAPVSIPAEGRLIGHEGVGRALAMGKHVRRIRPGDYLSFESLLACHECNRCRRGDFNQCRYSKLLGLEEDGLFSQVADLPASVSHVINDHLTEKNLPILSCLEPAAVAYLACQNARVKGGDTVVVFGAGPIGLYSAISASRVFGASRVYVVDPVPFRRDFARPWCDQVFDLPEFLDAPPAEIDVVVESSGILDNLDQIFPKITANGRAVLLGRCGHPLTINHPDHMITNAISIMGSRGHLGGAFQDLLTLYRNGKFPLEAPVTNVMNGLTELKDALLNHHQVLHENCKILVRLNDGQRPSDA